jgi:D-glycero-D-manno-heptose 1,7-bisphosphate phosphatase
MLRNIHCDRDGTIIYDKHYLCDPDGVELLPGAAKGLARLYKAGCRIFVATNQSGIGRGIYGMDEYKACARRLNKILSEEGVKIGGTVFCPHAPDKGEDCDCRKPKTGLWKELKVKHSLDAAQSVMIGDKSADIMFGKNSGLACTILVLTGKGLETAASLGLPTENPALVAQGYYEPSSGVEIPDCVALDLEWAADYILKKNGAS